MNEYAYKAGVAYFGVRNPRLAIQDLERIARAGYTHVLHTWSEEDLQYYAETMAELIRLSRSIGLGVYVNPWGVGRVFGGEAYTELAARNPSMAQQDQESRPLVASCPNHPLFRDYIRRWIETVCATEVETVFWDEPHFYFEKENAQLWTCSCPTCQDLFREQTGFSMPRTLTPEVCAFRERSLLDFLRFATDLVHKHGKRNSVCLLPPWFPAGLDDWEAVASMPAVDEIGSDPYWEKQTPLSAIGPMYTSVCNRVLETAQKYGKEAQIWIKNYHIVSGTEESVAIATRSAISCGMRNIFVWSYMGSAYMSWLKSDQPELVWETQCQALRELIAPTP